MDDDDLLTISQREPLLAMVRFQRQQGQDLRFTIPLGGLAISYQNQFHIMPPYHAREVWERQNYVFISQGQMSWTDPVEPGWEQSQPALILTLTQKAFAYERWLRRPTWQRWLIRQRQVWAPEVRAAVVSLITALITSVITVYILTWLGLA